MTSVAIVLTLASFGRTDEATLQHVAGEAHAYGTASLVIVPFGAADVAQVRGWCDRTAIAGAIVETERKSSFGGAANAGARTVDGDVLVFVNGAAPIGTGWLASLLADFSQTQAGVLGPRIVTNGGANEACGMIVASAQTQRGFDFHVLAGARGRFECDALPSDCLVTSRVVFDELGGFAETFGSELESIDFCLRVAESGRRVMFASTASFMRVTPLGLKNDGQSAREDAFTERWRDRAEPHENFWPEYSGSILRTESLRGILRIERVPIPRVAVLLHGEQPSPAFVAQLGSSRMKPASATWADSHAAVRTARELTELRGPDYVAFVRTDANLIGDWLNELVNAIERVPDTAAAIFAEPADARCTLVAPRRFPQHLRIEERGSFDAAVAAWLHAATDAGRTIARVRRSSTSVGAAAPDVFAQTSSVAHPLEPFASIVMLSWNAPEYTEIAIESLRSRTSLKHEIIIVDNGSGPETRSRLAAIPDIRVIYNAVNTGFAFACNQGIAAATGTHIVLLNNDVVVADGWLEALIAVQQAHPAVGCSAPRSNEIAGQQRLEVPYRDVADMPAFAAQRALEQRGRWTRQSRVIGMCMCLPRHVIEEIGGLDPRYGPGNFEDDDFCMRIRAAGYDIVVCEDSFVHHFGSVSFRANSVDYGTTFERNMDLFKQRWNVVFANGGYDGWLPSQRGFVRERDYVALPSPLGVGADWLPNRG